MTLPNLFSIILRIKKFFAKISCKMLAYLVFLTYLCRRNNKTRRKKMNAHEIYTSLKVVDTKILVKWYNENMVNPYDAEGEKFYIREVNEGGKRYAVRFPDRVVCFDTFGEFLDGMSDKERKGFIGYLMEYPEILGEIAK